MQKNLCRLIRTLLPSGASNFGVGAIDRFFPQQGNAGKDCFPVHYVFSPRCNIRGAIVYFLIFLLFAFRRFKSARLYNDVVL